MCQIVCGSFYILKIQLFYGVCNLYKNSIFFFVRFGKYYLSVLCQTVSIASDIRGCIQHNKNSHNEENATCSKIYQKYRTSRRVCLPKYKKLCKSILNNSFKNLEKSQETQRCDTVNLLYPDRNEE